MLDIFYVHNCLGLDGKPIDVYKLRTMDVDASDRLEEVVRDSELDGYGKIKDDPRITPIGRRLRRYWIDELPQLYNIVRRDLKLVGIRAKSEQDWKEYPLKLKERVLRQKPGLMAIQYAYPGIGSFDENLSHIDTYLREWEESPIKTDIKYFCRIVWSIIFKGVKSH